MNETLIFTGSAEDVQEQINSIQITYIVVGVTGTAESLVVVVQTQDVIPEEVDQEVLP